MTRSDFLNLVRAATTEKGDLSESAPLDGIALHHEAGWYPRPAPWPSSSGKLSASTAPGTLKSWKRVCSTSGASICCRARGRHPPHTGKGPSLKGREGPLEPQTRLNLF